MAFSVSKSRPFRSLGFGKSGGKHAAPRGRVQVPEQRQSVEATTAHSHRPAHAATMPRLTGPQASQAGTDHRAA
jgi:hypothetical protein